MKLNTHEEELLDNSLDIAIELAESDHSQHRALGQIIAGLCAIIQKGQIIDEIASPEPAHTPSQSHEPQP